jgi:hypothetical protein
MDFTQQGTELICHYLNNILSINLLLITLALFYLYHFMKTVCPGLYIYILLFSSIGLFMWGVIFDLFTFKDLVDNAFNVQPGSKLPADFRPLNQLGRLNCIFWLDIAGLFFLFFVFISEKYKFCYRKRYEKID